MASTVEEQCFLLENKFYKKFLFSDLEKGRVKETKDDVLSIKTGKQNN